VFLPVELVRVSSLLPISYHEKLPQHFRPEKYFGIIHVCTYICIVKLEQAIQTTKFSSQKQKAGLNIMYTAWWLKTVISNELKTIGLTQEQYNVLRILKGKDPEQMCVKDIGCRMIERNSNVPRIVDRLVAKNLVERRTSVIDKRETVIQLTPSGLDILNDATQKVNTVISKATAIEEADARLLNDLLEKFRKKKSNIFLPYYMYVHVNYTL
jgi:DNA-binding MarR family transcriptional regulator